LHFAIFQVNEPHFAVFAKFNSYFCTSKINLEPKELKKEQLPIPPLYPRFRVFFNQIRCFAA